VPDGSRPGPTASAEDCLLIDREVRCSLREIAAIKVVVPRAAAAAVDWSMQVHGVPESDQTHQLPQMSPTCGRSASLTARRCSLAARSDATRRGCVCVPDHPTLETEEACACSTSSNNGPRGAVAVLTLNRPEALNATNSDLHSAIRRIWDSLASDGQLRVCDHGAGRAFSAGGDLPLLQT